jgi:UDP-glucose 4-epimerase
VLDVRSEEAGQLLVDREVEILVHHAAQMDVRRSVADPVFDADVNLLGLLNLLEAAREGSLQQVIFASTGGAIYGEQDEHPADENHVARPLSPYGVAKLASERYLYFYHQEYDLDATCLRYANVYGPRQNPHGEAGVVAIFSRRLLDGEEAVINGDGLQTRDYVFVDDVVRANLASVDRPGFSIYNVGTSVETDVNTLFNHIAEAADFDGAPKHGPAAAGEQRRSCISSERMLEELSVAVDTPLSDGIAATVAWFREH